MRYPVTAAQLKEFTRKARKVERMLQGRGGSSVNPVLAIEKVGEILVSAELARFIPPKGGRIHLVRVPVQLDREWQEAVNAAGPDTPADYDVQKIGVQYPSKEEGVIEPEIILMNFGPHGGNWNRAAAWAKQHGLKRTNPRYVFAIGEHNPGLHHLLSMDPMYVVATEERAVGGRRLACDVWWDRAERRCRLRWVEYCGFSDDWFAFRRE